MTTHSPLRSCWSLCLAMGLSAPAHAGSIGLGLALVKDLPDPLIERDGAWQAIQDGLPASCDDPTQLDCQIASVYTRMGTGISLQIPVRISLGENVALRLGGRLDYAGGGGQQQYEPVLDSEGFPQQTRGGELITKKSPFCRELDAISWTLPGGETRFENPRCGWMVAGGLTLGPEITVPIPGPVHPYFSAGIGFAGVGNFHNIHLPELLDDSNNLTPEGLDFNIDPFSLQATLLTELAVGARFGERLYLEGGYSSARLGEAELKKSVEVLNVQRLPYMWNAVRISGGVLFPF